MLTLLVSAVASFMAPFSFNFYGVIFELDFGLATFLMPVGLLISCLEFLLLSFFSLSFSTKSQAYWLVIQSQIPSQAWIIKFELVVIGVFEISGTAETAILSGGSLTDLYSQSPIARLIAMTPSTLPFSTVCPEATTRDLSIGTSGLWSLDKSIALPFSHRTDLASPAFAQYTCVAVIRTTLAVQPAEKARSVAPKAWPRSGKEYDLSSFCASGFNIIMSILRNTFLRAYS